MRKRTALRDTFVLVSFARLSQALYKNAKNSTWAKHAYLQVVISNDNSTVGIRQSRRRQLPMPGKAFSET